MGKTGANNRKRKHYRQNGHFRKAAAILTQTTLKIQYTLDICQI